MKMRRPKQILAVLLSIFIVAELMVTVILSTVADGSEEPATKTITKQLIDFSNTETATGISDANWPKGISKLDYELYSYNSNFRVDIAEDNDEKFLKFNFDQLNNVKNNDTISARGRYHDIFLKVSVPYWYINYMQDFTVDMVYNYNKSSSGEQSKAYYIVGFSDGGNVYSKSTDVTHATIEKSASVQNFSVTKAPTDLGKYTDAAAKSFLGNTQGLTSVPKWTMKDFNALSKVDIIIMLSPPDIFSSDRNAGYYFGVKGVTVTLTGPTEEIDNVDNDDYVAPGIINFEEGTTLEEVKANNTVGFGSSSASELSNDAFEGNNAFLFRRRQDIADGSDYDSYFALSLKRSVARSQGITFMAKNPMDKAVSIRVWIKVGNDTGDNAHKGKYQFIVSLPANMTEYQRVSVYWNNVGLMSFSGGGEWWAGSSSGNAITADELASGVTLMFRNYAAMTRDDYGVLFDEFEYITPAFTNARTVTLVDFSGAEVGSELPENMSISTSYLGTQEIVENVDGTKSLRFNYDAPAATDYNQGWFEPHHMRCRPTITLKLSVPKGSLIDVSGIALDMTNNRADVGERNTTDHIYTDALWNFGVGDSVSGVYGKNPEINYYVNWLGNTVITQSLVGMLRCGSGSMGSWVSNTGAKWVKEDLSNIDTLVFYITVPDCVGTEGESFQLNSITLKFNEPSQYNETFAREIIHAEKAEALTSGTIAANTIKVGTQDVNSSEFRNAIEVEVKDAANTEALTFKNTLPEYFRNAKPFYDKDSAVFHMFAYSNVDSNFNIALVDKNGAEINTSVLIPAATTNLYNEVSVNLKEVYDAAIANDPSLIFNLGDIRAIKVLPIVSEPSTIKIAGVTVLTGPYIKSSEDPEKKKTVNLVNFDNCKVGSKGDNLELPSNVTVKGYEGSKEIVIAEDGSKALQVNLDKKLEVTGGELHQTNKRTNITVDVTVPLGTLKNIHRIYYTITNNAYSLAEQVSVEYTSPVTVIAFGDGGFVKQGQSAIGNLGAQKGTSTKLSLQVKDGFGGNNSYYYTSWMDPNSAIPVTEEMIQQFEVIRLYLAVPVVNGTDISKGLNFQINSIDLEFLEIPSYEEDHSRVVVDGSVRDVITTNKSTITSTYNKISSNNINYRTFKKYYEISAKAGNKAPVIVENSLSKFLRNVTPFVDGATFRLYYQTNTKTKAQLNFVNANGEKLPFVVELAKSTSDKFDQVDVNFKEVYDAFIAEGGVFNTDDIRYIELLPLSEKAIKIKMASPTLWTGTVGSASSVGNYYKALDDDSIRVEAYNYYIPDEYSTLIEILDPEATIAENDTKLPAGSSVIGMFRITLKNADGAIADPTGRFWVSYKLAADVDLEKVAVYEMFFDGSLVKLKKVVMDANNYISFQDRFASKIFAVLSVEPQANIKPIPDEEVDVPDFEYEEIIEDDKTEEEVVETTPSQSVIKKRRKKKNTTVESGLATWIWIAIAVAAVVVIVVTGFIVFFILRKKRKNGKGNVTA